MPHIDAVESDVKVILQTTCTKKSGGVLNLTGATVTLRWQVGSSTAVERTMTIADPAGGVVQYEFQAGELEAPVMEYEITATLADGTIVTTAHKQRLSVRERIA